jgi:transcriptional regulator with XRE-family HTH domain
MTRKGPYRLEDTPRQAANLGQRVAVIRKAWGWTQSDLADRLRVKKATVSAWERELATPNGISLIALAAVLNISPEALLGEVDFTIPPLLSGLAEGAWRSYQLPDPIDPSHVMLIEQGSAVGPVALNKLRSHASEALAQQRPVWLVIG